MIIKTPENKIPITFQEALNEFNKVKTILVECEDLFGIYAAHVFSRKYNHSLEDIFEEKEHVEHGIWYVLPE